MYLDIVCLGEALIDFIIDKKTNQYIPNPGGAPLNVACTLAKFNCKVAFIGKIGNDNEGQLIQKTFKDFHINDTNLLIDPEHPTTQAFVSIDDNGERHFSFNRNNSADIFLNKHEINADLLKITKLFHFGSLSLVNDSYETATKYALELAKLNNAIISFDPNIREDLWKNKSHAIKKIMKFLPFVDILKISLEELETLTKETNPIVALKHLDKYNIPIILVSDGKNGAMVKTKSIIGNVKTINVEAVDTTGAGDIFLGTFLTQIIKKNKPINDISYDELLSFTKKACIEASLSTLTKGAIPAIHKLENI